MFIFYCNAKLSIVIHCRAKDIARDIGNESIIDLISAYDSTDFSSTSHDGELDASLDTQTHTPEPSGVVSILSAIKDADLSILERLLSQGDFDINTCDDDGYTPLLCAVEKNQLPVIQAVLGVQGIDVNIQHEQTKATALMYAAKHGNLSVCYQLIKKGAKRSLKDTLDKTAQNHIPHKYTAYSKKSTSIFAEPRLSGAISKDIVVQSLEEKQFDICLYFLAHHIFDAGHLHYALKLALMYKQRDIIDKILNDYDDTLK